MGMGWGLNDPVPRRAPIEKKQEERNPSVLEKEEPKGGRLLFGGDGKYKEAKKLKKGKPSERRDC